MISRANLKVTDPDSPPRVKQDLMSRSERNSRDRQFFMTEKKEHKRNQMGIIQDVLVYGRPNRFN